MLLISGLVFLPRVLMFTILVYGFDLLVLELGFGLSLRIWGVLIVLFCVLFLLCVG